jgi:ribonuclease P/MRP protein subunit RPP40
MPTWHKQLEKKLVSLLLFVDFKKAFDLVDSELLLAKLLNYGLQNSSILLLKNYLQDRKQFIKMNGCSSDIVVIKLVVPQVSVLDPLLFLISLNNMPHSLQDFICILFADDTTLGQSSENYEDLLAQFQKSIEVFLSEAHIIEWT